MQYENTIPKRKNLRKFIWCTRGMRWSRLFWITLTLVSLAKSYASLISCIGSLASGRSVGFWHGSGIPAQQEDSAEDTMQEKGWHRRKECPKFEEIGAPAKGG